MLRHVNQVSVEDAADNVNNLYTYRTEASLNQQKVFGGRTIDRLIQAIQDGACSNTKIALKNEKASQPWSISTHMDSLTMVIHFNCWREKMASLAMRLCQIIKEESLIDDTFKPSLVTVFTHPARATIPEICDSLLNTEMLHKLRDFKRMEKARKKLARLRRVREVERTNEVIE